MMEPWQYEGEPTAEEIIQRKANRYDDHLAIRHCCPCCGGRDTEWIRNQYSICFTCEISFTLEDTKPYYIKEELNVPN